MTAKLPEGGMGGLIADYNRGENTFHDAVWDVFRTYERQSGNRIKFEYRSKNQYLPEMFAVDYVRRNGKRYEIWAPNTERYSNREFYDRRGYLAGQVAYCIAKGAFSLDNLAVVRNDELPAGGNFVGDNFLICRSPKLPKGYMVLTNLDGASKDEFESMFSKVSRKAVGDEDFDSAYKGLVDMMQHAPRNTDEGKLTISLCILIEIGAMANDLDHSR